MARKTSEYLVWAVCLVGLVGLPFFTMSTEQVSWSTFAESYCISLTTMFASNNGFAGNTFDIENVGNQSTEITTWWVNLDQPGTSDTVDIYWRSGTSVGFEDDPNGWTLLGSDSTVVSNGADVPTPVTMPTFVIHSNEVFGFYVHSAGGLILYSNGGPNTYSDSSLSITTYTGKGLPVFTGTTIEYRTWNGSVGYCEYGFFDDFESGNTSAWSNTVP